MSNDTHNGPPKTFHIPADIRALKETGAAIISAMASNHNRRKRDNQ
jgi:hypothetical protein